MSFASVCQPPVPPISKGAPAPQRLTPSNALSKNTNKNHCVVPMDKSKFPRNNQWLNRMHPDGNLGVSTNHMQSTDYSDIAVHAYLISEEKSGLWGKLD